MIIRRIIMPFMLKQQMNQQEMKVKMDQAKPEMEDLQQKFKATESFLEEKTFIHSLSSMYFRVLVKVIRQ